MLPIRLLRNKPNITHSTSHIGPVWGPGKRVVTVHDLIFRRYPQDYNPIWLLITRLTLPAVLRRAAAIIADSHATKRDVERFYGVHPTRIVVVYPGVDRVYPVAGDLRAGPAARLERYVLCLGPWVRRKNLEVVVRAFGQIAPRIPDLRLVITGEPVAGMQGYTPAQLIGALPADIRSRVQLTGYVARDELLSLLANASALAYPSRWEGFGLPPLEAMSAGVPVLASDTPAVAEATGGAACLCDPDDAQQWARALERVLLDHEHAQRMIEAGRRQSATFTWERCAAQTARVYHHIANSARAGSNGGRA
jgi:alpha-1,3-rhamnosyl/mannosyltransferase